MSPQVLDELSAVEQLFQALADRTRLRILALLLTGEVCVCVIHESLGLSQPKVSRHLAYLRRAGLVDARREGQWIHYRVARLPGPVVRTIQDAVAHALWHLPQIKHDAGRLARRQPCRIPESGDPPGCACCESGT